MRWALTAVSQLLYIPKLMTHTSTSILPYTSAGISRILPSTVYIPARLQYGRRYSAYTTNTYQHEYSGYTTECLVHVYDDVRTTSCVQRSALTHVMPVHTYITRCVYTRTRRVGWLLWKVAAELRVEDLTEGAASYVGVWVRRWDKVGLTFIGGTALVKDALALLADRLSSRHSPSANCEELSTSVFASASSGRHGRHCASGASADRSTASGLLHRVPGDHEPCAAETQTAHVLAADRDIRGTALRQQASHLQLSLAVGAVR